MTNEFVMKGLWRNMLNYFNQLHSVYHRS